MEETQTTQAQQSAQDKQITVSSALLCSLCAVVALGILIICKICANFGVGNKTFYGIMSIFIYVLPLCGVVLTYATKKSATTELWMNVAVLAIALMTF